MIAGDPFARAAKLAAPGAIGGLSSEERSALLREVEQSHKFWTYAPTPLQRIAWECSAPELWLQCGSRSSKTTDIAVWLIWQALNALPITMQRLQQAGQLKIGCPRCPEPSGPKRIGAIIIPTYRQSEHGIMEALPEWCPPMFLWGGSWEKAWSEQRKQLRWADGGKLFLVSVEAGMEAIEGATLAYAAIDEDMPRELQGSFDDIMSSLYTRFATTQRRMRAGFTPYQCAKMGGVSWVTRNIGAIRTEGTPIQWSEKRPGCAIVNWPMWANPVIGTEERTRVIAAEAKWEPWEWACRALGLVVSRAQSPAFDEAGMERLRAGLREGRVVAWIEGPPARATGARPFIPIDAPGNGPCRLWEPPVVGAEYVAGVDVAAGVRADASVLWLKRRATGLYVCKLATNRLDPAAFADACGPVLAGYGFPILNAPRDPVGVAFLARMVERKYPRLAHEHQLARYKTDAPARDTLGFSVAGAGEGGAREVMLTRFREGVRSGRISIMDKETIREMEIFHWDDERHRFDHPPGCHDDHIFAACAAEAAEAFLSPAADVAQADAPPAGLSELGRRARAAVLERMRPVRRRFAPTWRR